MQRDLVRLVAVARRDGVGSPGWDRALEEFLSRNYFHGDVELDISVPRWGERPERVRQLVEDILRSGIDPKDPDRSAQAQFEAFVAEEQRVLRAIRRSLAAPPQAGTAVSPAPAPRTDIPQSSRGDARVFDARLQRRPPLRPRGGRTASAPRIPAGRRRRLHAADAGTRSRADRRNGGGRRRWRRSRIDG